MASELKPCPFCGSNDARQENNNGEPYVRCVDCGCSVDGMSGAWNTRPAAPVEGLESYEYGFPSMTKVERGGDWCDRSQAEAIIAAKDAGLDVLENRAAQLQVWLNELRHDNAALTARVEELGEDRDHWKANHDCVLGKYRLAAQRPDLPVDRLPAIRKLEALETQLAAAKKALEPFAEIAGEPWADANGWTDAACQKDRIVDWFGPSAFLEARAALEGKP